MTVSDRIYFQNEVNLVLVQESVDNHLRTGLPARMCHGETGKGRCPVKGICRNRFVATNFQKRHYQEQKFVLVFPKYTVGENEKLEIEVREQV